MHPVLCWSVWFAHCNESRPVQCWSGAGCLLLTGVMKSLKYTRRHNTWIEKRDFDVSGYSKFFKSDLVVYISHVTIYWNKIMLRNVRYSLIKGSTSHYILTAAKFQWARVSIHRKVLQVHWTFSLDCKPKRQKISMH